MILIFGEPNDATAIDLVDGLSGLGVAAVFRWRLDQLWITVEAGKDYSASDVVDRATGKTVTAIVNRHRFLWDESSSIDESFAMQENSAAWWACLAAFEGTVVNRHHRIGAPTNGFLGRALAERFREAVVSYNWPIQSTGIALLRSPNSTRTIVDSCDIGGNGYFELIPVNLCRRVIRAFQFDLHAYDEVGEFLTPIAQHDSLLVSVVLEIDHSLDIATILDVDPLPRVLRSDQPALFRAMCDRIAATSK